MAQIPVITLPIDSTGTSATEIVVYDFSALLGGDTLSSTQPNMSNDNPPGQPSLTFGTATLSGQRWQVPVSIVSGRVNYVYKSYCRAQTVGNEVLIVEVDIVLTGSAGSQPASPLPSNAVNPNTFWAGPASGSPAGPSQRTLVMADLPASAQALTANQAENLFLAGPSSGSAAPPVYRAITSTDLANALSVGQTIHTGADTNVGLTVEANSATQSANLLNLTDNNGNPLAYVNSAGNASFPYVGIGTAPRPDLERTLFISNTPVNPTTEVDSCNITTIYGPASPSDVGVYGLDIGSYFEGNSNSPNCSVNGVYCVVTVQQTTGGVLGASSAMRASVDNYGTGSITSAVAFGAGIDSGGGGVITEGIALLAEGSVSNASGMGTFYGLLVESFSTEDTSTVTNNYAIYVQSQTAGTSINYAIYTNAGPNYLGDKLTVNGSLIVGTAELPTNATTGFLYIPTCAGAPTATPASESGVAPIVYDVTDNRLYVFNGGWKSVALS